LEDQIMAGEESGKNTGKSETKQPVASTGGKRKRRWLRGILIFAVVVLVLLWVMPYLVSTGAGNRLVVSVANRYSPNKIELAGLSLRWLGPTEIEGVKIRDTDGADMLDVQKVVWGKGLWCAITGPMNFGEVNVESLKADIKMDEKPAPKPKEKPVAAKLLPSPKGRITLKNCMIRVRRPDGAELKVTDINSDVTIDTLNNIKGTLTLLTGGGRINGTLAVQNLVRDGEINPLQATMAVQLGTEKETQVDLTDLVKFAAGDVKASGRVRFNIEANMKGDDVQSNFNLNMAGLQAAYQKDTAVKPIDVNLKGDVSTAAKKIQGQINLDGQFGGLKTEFSYLPPEKTPQITAAQIMDAVLGGKPITLPEFSLTSSGQVDVAVLGRAIPALLKLRPGLELTGGNIKIDKLTAQGGAAPTIQAAMMLSEIKGIMNSQSFALQPVSSNIDVALESQKGLAIRSAAVESSFVRLKGSGTAHDINLTFNGDLGALQQEVGKIVAWEQPVLKGRFDGALAAKRNAEVIDLSLNATMQGLQYEAENKVDGKTEKKTLTIAKASLGHNGQLELDRNNQPTMYTAKNLQLDVDNQVLIQSTGWYKLEPQTFHGELNLIKADLAGIGGWARQMGQEAISKYTGVVSVAMKADRSGKDGAIVVNGSGGIKALQIVPGAKAVASGTPTSPPAPPKPVDVDFSWSELRWMPSLTELKLATIKLDSELAHLAGQNIQGRFGKDTNLNGQFDLKSDLSRSVPFFSQAAGRKEPLSAGGQFHWSGNADTSGGVLAVKGGGEILDMVLGQGDKAFRDSKVTISDNAQIDTGRKVVTVQDFALASTALKFTLSGTVKDYETQRLLALKGNYQGSWDQLTLLIHQFAPDTQQTVSIAGVTQSDFEISGPAQQPKVVPVFRGVNSQGFALGWTSATMYGIKLGTAKLQPVLKDGIVTLPPTSIPAGDGKINLGAMVDMTTPTPILNMPGKTALLQKVGINPEVGNFVLSRVNPIFAGSAQLQGEVSMEVQDLTLPLNSEELKRSGTGKGVVNLRDVRIAPGGFFGEVLALVGLQKAQLTPMTFSDLTFEIKQGRLYYDNFVVKTAELIEVKFYGSVPLVEPKAEENGKKGEAEGLDLTMSIPLRPPLLERVGVKVPGNIGELTDVRVDIPIRGSRKFPRMDLATVNIGEVLKKTVEKGVLKPGGQLLDLLKPQTTPKPAAPPAPAKPPATAP
jgi:hypothetical protein